MKNTHELATEIIFALGLHEIQDHRQLIDRVHKIIESRYMEPTLPDGRELVYFIDEEDFGEGSLAHNLRTAHQWFDAFWENLDDDEISVVRFKKIRMTKEEIEAMPEI